MIASAIFYTAAAVVVVCLSLAVKPLAALGVTRRWALFMAGCAAIVSAAALQAPASEARAPRIATRLDEFLPVWQFHEVHTRRIAASPDRVFQAIRTVRADEIALFHTLTWIRRGGRPVPRSILDAGSTEPIVDVATRTGFVRLAEDAPGELVIGTIFMPPGPRPLPTPELFRKPPPSAYALVAMNFLVTPESSEGSVISTETRVFATSAAARSRFAVYWRLIYPGSAIIRRMWLRAIERRAVGLS